MTVTGLEILSRSMSGAVAGASIADLVDDLVQGLSAAIGVDAVGIVVRSAIGDLELLSASSHRMAELELYQTADEEGPCFECVRTGDTIFVRGDDITLTWPGAGAVITAAGFQTVLSMPMLWRGRPLASLNLFWRVPRDPTPEERSLARTFADTAMLLLEQGPSGQCFPRNVVSALNGRVIVEYAKGALAAEHGIDVSSAYDELRRRARAQGQPLSEAARTILAAYTQDVPPT